MRHSPKILPHKNLFTGITGLLKRVLIEGKQADKEMETLFKAKKKWGKRDRGFIAETVYDCIRWKRKIEYQMGSEFNTKNLWTGVGIWFSMAGNTLPDWPEFDRVKTYTLKHKYPSAAVAESIPDWLWQEGVAQMGEERFLTEIVAMNDLGKLVLRVNGTKTTKEDLQKTLEEHWGILSRPIEGVPSALEV